MNEIIKYGSVQGNPLYNCSAHTPEEWTRKDGIRWPILGSSEAIFGILANIIYIPTILVMLEKDNFRISCYKMMTLLAIIDASSIFVSGIITGILAYQGAVFCSYPELIYYSGATGKGCWCCECIIALILVTNRLIDSAFPKVTRFFFEGNRTFLFLLVAILYGMYFSFSNTPILFTSKYHSWFFDPMIFEGKSMDYENVPILYNNLFTCITTCFLYVVFCCVLCLRVKNLSTNSGARMTSLRIFFQCALICAVNMISAMTYLCMNYFNVPLFIIVGGQLLWLFGNAAPVLIYLKFNKTIRMGILRKLGLQKPRKMSLATITKSGISTTQVHAI